MDLSIIPECYVDTNLIETLVPPTGKGYNHQHGCATVAKVMKEKFVGVFALGIIDKDKKEINYLQEFDLVIASGSLFLHKHKRQSHYLIQISPAVERMIISNAAEVDVRMEDFELSSNLKELIDFSKKRTSKDDNSFKRLFKAMIKASAPDLIILEVWIKYLKEKKDQADMDELKKLL